MSGAENFAFMAPLHQMRVSQIPLRPSEPTASNINARIAFAAMKNQDHMSGPIEMQSSLDHVRYNIVGKCSPISIPFHSIPLNPSPANEPEADNVN
jgi:hypothetical protein